MVHVHKTRARVAERLLFFPMSCGTSAFPVERSRSGSLLAGGVAHGLCLSIARFLADSMLDSLRSLVGASAHRRRAGLEPAAPAVAEIAPGLAAPRRPPPINRPPSFETVRSGRRSA